jgi:hypothetical protein
VRLKRLNEQIEKLRGNSGEGTTEPRRVGNAAFFARILEMQQKGGAGTAPGKAV